MRPMRTFSAFLVLALLSACGQTGELYLPNKTPPPSAAQPEDKDKKKAQTPGPAQPAPPPAPPH